MANNVSRKLRLPVRFVEVQWELSSGGGVPAMEGAEAELILTEGEIADTVFLDRYRQRSHIKILPFGTALRACLNVKDAKKIPGEQRQHLIPWDKMRDHVGVKLLENWSSVAYSFVEVSIGPATQRQVRTHNIYDGGLWLTILGNKPEALTTSQIRLPTVMDPDHARRMNHPFTRLSEVYELWRLAHTGSVYDRYLYQEADGRWYPLKLLRDASVANEGQNKRSRLICGRRSF